MKSRGRKSAASLTVVPLGLGSRRPEPPAHLSTGQAATWRAIVGELPANWVTAGQEPLLVAYCQHCETAKFLSQWIASTDFQSCHPAELNLLLTMRARETAAASSLATRMRLTNQSRMHPRTAGRRTEGQPGGSRPWESGEA